MAPQSSKECHFINWSVCSERILTLWPGDMTNVGMTAEEVLVDELVEEHVDDADDPLEHFGDQKKCFFGG